MFGFWYRHSQVRILPPQPAYFQNLQKKLVTPDLIRGARCACLRGTARAQLGIFPYSPIHPRFGRERYARIKHNEQG